MDLKKGENPYRMFKWRYSRINNGWRMMRIGKDSIEVRDLKCKEKFILWLYKILNKRPK